MVAYAANIKEDSDMCAGLQDPFKFFCCPAPADDPCVICAGDITAGEEFVISEEGDDVTTCADVVAYAANVEEASPTCAGVKRAKAAYCPTPVDNPCTLCPAGITVDDGFVVLGSNGMSCAALAQYVGAAAESSEVCSESKYAEIFYCRTSATRPFPVCAAGLTVEESPCIPDADCATCGDLVYYASGTKEESDMCAVFREEEKICRPAREGGHQEEGGHSTPKLKSEVATRSSGKGGEEGKEHEANAPTTSAANASEAKGSKAVASTSKSSKAKSSKAKTGKATTSTATAKHTTTGAPSARKASPSTSKGPRYHRVQTLPHRDIDSFRGGFRAPSKQSTTSKPSTRESTPRKSRDHLYPGSTVSHHNDSFRDGFREP